MDKCNLQNTSRTDNLSGAIGLMVVSALCIALLNLFYKQSMLHLSLSLAVFVRMLLPLLVLLPWVKSKQISLRRNWHIHILRGFIVFVYTYAPRRERGKPAVGEQREASVIWEPKARELANEKEVAGTSVA